jgi:hypothetical protein
LIKIILHQQNSPFYTSFHPLQQIILCFITLLSIKLPVAGM